MATRTQLRLHQLSASYGHLSKGIVDDLGANAAPNLGLMAEVSGNFIDQMSEIASAIRRIHGGGTFAGVDAGQFQQALSGTAGMFLQGDIHSVGEARFDSNVFLGDDAASDTVVFGAKVDSDLDPKADASYDLGGPAERWNNLYAAAVNATAVDAAYITGSAEALLASAKISDLTNDRVVIAGAGGELEDDANFTYDGSTLTLGGSVDLDVGGDASVTGNLDVTGNAIITGDLTVNGTTTTLDTTNLLVEDPIVAMASNAAALNTQGGLAIMSGSDDASSPDLVFGRVDASTWGFGKKATDNGTTSTLADMTLVAARASKLEIDSASDYVALNGSNLNIVASADLEIDAANGIMAGVFKPDADSTRDLGADGTAWAKLYVDDIDLNGQGRIDLDEDADTSIRASADDVISIEIGAADTYEMDAGKLGPATGVTADLGATGDRWDNVYAAALAANGNDAVTMDQSGDQRIVKSGAGELQIVNSVSNEAVSFADGFIGSSASYTGTHIPLAASAAEFDAFAGLFGGTASILSAIAAARAGTVGAGKFVTEINAPVVAGTDVTFAGLDYSAVLDPDNLIDVFVNGQLLMSGTALAGAAPNDYTLDTAAGPDKVAFAFDLNVDDVVTMVIR